MTVRSILLSCALLALAGCATPLVGPDNTVELSLLPGDAVSLGGREVPLSRLGRSLKAGGASPRTRILIHTPQSTPSRTVLHATRLLARAGFGKVVFLRKMSPDASLRSTPPSAAPGR